MVAIVYIETVKSKQKNKVYQQILLRESYREPGAPRSAVKKRTLLNLTPYPAPLVEAMKWALKHQDDLSALVSLKEVNLKQGPSVGGVWALFQTAHRLGIAKALGADHHGKLALWQVVARALSPGSRLAAVRLAKKHAAAAILGFERGVNEDDLYDNLTWLAEHQEQIEDRLFAARRGETKPRLFLYDVTSSYLEGEHNELADWGYNRDKKQGKKQIVIGLLCDETGEPVSTEVFTGNTSDLQTFESQIEKAARRFGCQRVTFVGDRGMIKSGQIEDLSKAGFHYITAITKSQIRSLLKKGVFQLGLFDERLCEVEQDGVRYILRRNPIRAEEMAENRASRLAALVALAEQQNQYLAAHPRADQYKAWQKVLERESRLGLSPLVRVTAEDRHIHVEVDEAYWAEVAELDGCYAIKTDLPAEAAAKEVIHERYKDLALVEQGFRTMKTDYLKVRPVFVRTQAHTRGHVLVVMLAYLLVRALKRAWHGFDLTVQEGIEDLSRISTIEVSIKAGGSYLRIPSPPTQTKNLLKALKVKLPTANPKSTIKVDTKKKLYSRRK